MSLSTTVYLVAEWAKALKWEMNSEGKALGVRHRNKNMEQEMRLWLVCRNEERSRHRGEEETQKENCCSVQNAMDTTRWNLCRSKEAMRRVQVL